MVQTAKPHVVQTTKPHVFIDHIIYREGEALPPVSPDNLYEYVVAQNGVFVRSERAGLSAVIPVLSNRYVTLRGLAELNPEVSLTARVRLELTEQILELCREAMPDECLMWLGWQDGKYSLTVPDQSAGRMRVAPSLPFQREGADALIDLHSHNSMAPRFSETDDQDETGFRIFAVVGMLDQQPCIMTRVGVFGHFWTIPPEQVFEMPCWLVDYFSAMMSMSGDES